MVRLYLRIYLAVLASLVIFALLAGFAWRFHANDPVNPRQAIFAAAAEKLIPKEGSAPEDYQQALVQWNELSAHDFALFSRDGRRLADTSQGEIGLPRRFAEDRGGMAGRRHNETAVALADGRVLVVKRPTSGRSPVQRFRWLMILFGIGVAVAIAAYPVVRRLLSRLEKLEKGVKRFGEGDLSVRVPVEGKDEVASLAQTFNQSASRIETLMTANAALLANASHELRSPLARLRMGIETLPPAVKGPQREELSRNIRELDQLIEEILLASRLDKQGEHMVMRQDDIDVIALVAEEAAYSKAQLSFGDGALPVIRGDDRLIRRMVRNLIDNAVRHATVPDIDIQKAADGAVTIDVADRGAGIPDGERERIFEPFYRANGTHEKDGGVGLGLALVKQIAVRHGGSVVSLPRQGGGSVFRVRLPQRGPQPA
jgi:signal transduction histidine kinase